MDANYVVAQALTNTAKHVHASEVKVNAEANGTNLLLSIRDDEIGGAKAVTRVITHSPCTWRSPMIRHQQNPAGFVRTDPQPTKR